MNSASQESVPSKTRRQFTASEKLRLVKAAEAAGLAVPDPELKRAPRGYPPDHPRIDRLRMKELTVYRRHRLEPWLHESACDERIMNELEGARPLVAWLAKNVGPPEQPRGR